MSDEQAGVSFEVAMCDVIIPKMTLQDGKNSPQQYYDQFRPIIEGPLLSKCKDGRFRSRYYVLSSHRLLQYDSPALKRLNLCIDFRTVQLQSLRRSQTLIKYFKIQFSEYKLVLKADNPGVSLDWYVGLTSVIGKCLDAGDKSSKQGSLKEISVLLKELLDFADTFDILLFRSTDKIAGVQRFVTGSQYDHVGLLLKSQNQQLYMIETNSRSGVCLLDQASLMSKIRASKKVAFRKLLAEKRNDQIQILQKSLDGLLQCDFEFGFHKLLGKEKKSQSRTYFCSQLVAQVYQKCGLLNTKIPPNKFWPNDFQKTSKVGGLEFGPLIRVQIP